MPVELGATAEGLATLRTHGVLGVAFDLPVICLVALPCVFCAEDVAAELAFEGFTLQGLLEALNVSLVVGNLGELPTTHFTRVRGLGSSPFAGGGEWGPRVRGAIGATHAAAGVLRVHAQEHLADVWFRGDVFGGYIGNDISDCDPGVFCGLFGHHTASAIAWCGISVFHGLYRRYIGNSVTCCGLVDFHGLLFFTFSLRFFFFGFI